MSEILLQAIVEKLEAFEKSQELKSKIEDGKELKEMQERLRMIHIDIKSISRQIFIPAGDIVALKETIAEFNIHLQETSRQQVKHIHYASKSLLACIVLVFIIVGLCIWIGKIYDASNPTWQTHNDWGIPENIHLDKNKVNLNEKKDKTQGQKQLIEISSREESKHPKKKLHLNKKTDLN